MKINKEIRKYIRELRIKVTPGLWGRFGLWQQSKAPQPTKLAFEATPGLSIGSTQSHYQIARFSGYGMDVASNADYVTIVVNHIEDLLNDLDELEEENSLLREILQRGGNKN